MSDFTWSRMRCNLCEWEGTELEVVTNGDRCPDPLCVGEREDLEYIEEQEDEDA